MSRTTLSPQKFSWPPCRYYIRCYGGTLVFRDVKFTVHFINKNQFKNCWSLEHTGHVSWTDHIGLNCDTVFHSSLRITTQHWGVSSHSWCLCVPVQELLDTWETETCSYMVGRKIAFIFLVDRWNFPITYVCTWTKRYIYAVHSSSHTSVTSLSSYSWALRKLCQILRVKQKFHAPSQNIWLPKSLHK
jgi:hypothetical protein